MTSYSSSLSTRIVLGGQEYFTYIFLVGKRCQGMHDGLSFWKYLTPIIIVWISAQVSLKSIYIMTIGVR